MKQLRGFTLMETIISMALFAILTTVMFKAVSAFQKTWLKEYSKQSVSKQFVKTYNTINSDFSGSSGALLKHYQQKNILNGSRWFMFPVTEEVSNPPPSFPLPENTIGVSKDGYPLYTMVLLYSLEVPPHDNCKKDGSPDSPNQFCPHKQLVRRKILITREDLQKGSGNNLNGKVMVPLFNNINEILNLKKTGTFSLSGFYFYDIAVIERDITDLTIVPAKIDHDFEIGFHLKVLRIADAQKFLAQSKGGSFGERQLIDAKGNSSTTKKDIERYMEETAWTSISQNN